METVYLYCVARKGLSLLEALKGIGDSPLELFSLEELVVVGSVLPSERWAGPPPSFILQDLVLHKEVVEYVHALSPVIPMRFPTTLNGREKVVEFLQRHSSHLKETLYRLEGKVEVSLRIILDSKECGPSPTFVYGGGTGTKNGLEYLRQKRQMLEKEYHLGLYAQGVSKVLEHKLRSLITESQTESNGSMFSIYYLVEENRLEEFERVFGEVKSSFPEKVLYSGPWPPYSFVPKSLEI